MTRITISLSDDLGAFLASQVGKCGLGGVDEYIVRLIEQARDGERVNGASADAGGNDSPPIWEVFEKIMEDVPPEALAKLPTDAAEQHDHYIYGTPKRST